jgi:vitamin B12 transporter
VLLPKISVIAFLLVLAGLYGQADSVILEPVEVWADAPSASRFIPGNKVTHYVDSIALAPLASVSHALAYDPAIRIVRNGAGGALQSLQMNSLDGSQVAVKINGVKINSVQHGGVDFATLFVFPGSRIALDYAAGATTAGASAMGGAMHLQTNLAAAEDNTTLRFSAGSFANYRFLGQQSLRVSENAALLMHYFYEQGEDNYTYKQLNRTHQVHNGAFSRQAFDLSGYYRFARRQRLDWFARVGSGQSGVPSASAANSEAQAWDNLLSTLRFTDRIAFLGDYEISAAYLYDRYFYQDVGLLLESEFHNRQYRVNATSRLFDGQVRPWRLSHGLAADYATLAGLDGAQTVARSTLAYQIYYAHVISLAPDQALSLALAASIDYASDDPQPRLNYRLGANYLLPDVDIFASHYTGFRRPTFNDLYWPGQGNANLQIETSRALLIGGEVALPWQLQLRIAWQHIRASNMIRWTPASGNLWRPENLSNMQSDNVKLNLAKSGTSYQLQAGLLWQQAEQNNLRLRYVPTFVFTWYAAFQPTTWLHFFSGMRSESQRPRFDGATDEGDFHSAYMQIDIGFGVKIAPVNFLFSIFNLNDQTYYLQNQLPMKGIHYEISLAISL